MRQRRTRDEWISIFAKQQASELSIPKYCEKHNILLHTFYARRSEFNKNKVRPSTKLVKVVKPVALSIPTASIVCRGVTLNIGEPVDTKWIVDVMKALAS